jgi:outer membrane protein OmpA-like peptidoglycan-associated protein
MHVCSPRASLRRRFSALHLALLWGALCSPVLAADPPTLKDVLSKAQTEAETRAVNDLIEKLRGARPKAPAATPPASSGPSAPAVAAPAASQTEQGTGSSAAASAADAPRDTAPGAASVAAPAAPNLPALQAPEAAVEAAERKRLPSVDLEIFFAYDSDEIGAEALPPLRTLGQALKDASLADDAFLIAGHTDAKGGQRFNLDLSRRRAEAVRRFLVANFGIAETRLVAKGFGFAHPKNSSAPLSAENRRVQIVNLSKGQPH